MSEHPGTVNDHAHDHRQAESSGTRWLTTMRARDPEEAHRVATPLELFFDLVFVVAVAFAAEALHQALADAKARTHRLVGALRRERKRSRLVSSTLATLRQIRLQEAIE